MAATPETKVKNTLKKILDVKAKWHTSISDRYHVGMPDHYAILDGNGGKLTALEVKSATGMPTPRQIEEGRRITAAGGEFYVVRPGNDRNEVVLIDPFNQRRMIWRTK